MTKPELKRQLEERAKAEGRTTSNLSERLLQWAYEQLVVAGDSYTLLSWKASRDSNQVERQTAIERAAYEAAKPSREQKKTARKVS
ncbi:MAG: hypothetical protein ACRD4S_16810 [Candidatus Acidiferrales bacterium]